MKSGCPIEISDPEDCCDLQCDPQQPGCAEPPWTCRSLREAGDLEGPLSGAFQASIADQIQLCRKIFESSPLGIGIYAPEGRCVAVNQAMADLVGGSVDQLRAQDFHQVPSWRASGLYEAVHQVLAHGQPISQVIRFKSSFGIDAWLAFTASQLQVGHHTRLMLIVKDVSRLKAEELAREALQERFRLLFDHSMDGIVQATPGGAILAANPAACAMLGMTEAEVIARGSAGILDLQHPAVAEFIATHRATGQARGELTFLRKDGSTFIAAVASSVYTDEQGHRMASTLFRDVTESRRSSEQLIETLSLLRDLAEHVPGFMFQYRVRPDGQRSFPYASSGIQELYGLQPDDVVRDASPVIRMTHPDDLAGLEASARVSAQALTPWHHEFRVTIPGRGIRWHLCSAKPTPLPDGSVLWHGLISDVTERKASETHVRELAYFDALTGLPNRRWLQDHLIQELSAARRKGLFGALIFIDLDNFKRINDAKGHATGDALLKQVAARLAKALRREDAVVRLGGDEFVAVIGSLGADRESSARKALDIADKLRGAVQGPYEMEGSPYRGSASLGIAIFPKAAETHEDLLREADTAMYRAKEGGRNRVCFFEPEMQEEVTQRLRLEQELRQAIELGQLSLDAQSKVNAQGDEIGCELLLRWESPTLGPLPSSTFVPMADDMGHAKALTRLVLACASRVIAETEPSHPEYAVAVNISKRQFTEEGFVDSVRAALQTHGARPERLMMNITEHLISTVPDARARIQEVNALGIRFSISDYGNGGAGLSHLAQLPVSQLKIDPALIAGLAGSTVKQAVVRSIVAIAQHLGLDVTATGIQTPEQHQCLGALGCTGLQGDLFSPPEPVDRWLELRTPRGATAA